MPRIGTMYFWDEKFRVGCNYWGSYAGIRMWSDWRPESVERDMDALAAMNITLIRAFPLWSDFQPIVRLYGCGGIECELVSGGNEKVCTADDAGVAPEMLERFRFLCRAAEKRGIGIVVGLLTGWMSGRLFAPPALSGRKLLTDPEAIRTEVRFIRRFVSELGGEPAILGWDPGNECNCLQRGVSDAEAWLWLYAITSAIRAADPARPVISGMHGGSQGTTPFNLHTTGELLDAATTHPYPLFTRHSGTAPFNAVPTTFHAVAESIYYAGISGRACLIEEAGSLGPMFASAARAGAGLDVMLHAAWTHGLGTVLWWCGFDQSHLEYAPYRWCAMERELGLFGPAGDTMPTAEAIRNFAARLKRLGLEKLPPRRIDAVALTLPAGDAWQAAFGSFILAVQAGFELSFADGSGPIPEADFYVLPAVAGTDGIPRDRYFELLERVRNGATLLVTSAGGTLQPFASVFGVEADYTLARTPRELHVPFSGTAFSVRQETARKLLPRTAETLAATEDGEPVFTRQKFGRGQVMFLNFAPEQEIPYQPQADYFRFYAAAAACAGVVPPIPEKSRDIGVTVHPLPDGGTLLVAINYSDAAGRIELPPGKLRFADPPVHGKYAEIPPDHTLILGYDEPSEE